MIIDDSVCAKLLKFADGTKVFSVVATKNDIDMLQIDLKIWEKGRMNG